MINARPFGLVLDVGATGRCFGLKRLYIISNFAMVEAHYRLTRGVKEGIGAILLP